MNREQKAAVIDEVAAQIREAQAIFAVDYRGLTVRQAAELRGRLLAIDANLRVVKNTLTERAADSVGAEGLKQYLQGPTAFTFVNGDPVMAAKAIAGFRREANNLPEWKGGVMDGKELTIEDIEALSKLPSLEVMHGQLVGLVANPLSSLVRTLNALLSGIAIALGQIHEQGLVTGEAPAAAEPAADEPAAAEPAAEAASADAGDAPANDGDGGAEAVAAAPADAADAEPAAADSAPAADAEPAAASVPAAAEAEDPAETNAADAIEADVSPTAPADAPQPEAAEEIPNQPMPAPEAAEEAGDATETSNDEGDN